MSASPDGIVLVHAGHRPDAPDRAQPRFPTDRMTYVGERLAALVSVLRPTGLVTAAAAGADLLAARAAVDAGVSVHLVLPTARARFRATSVVDRGDVWGAAFDWLLEHVDEDPACSLVELNIGEDKAGFKLGSRALLDRANELAPGRVLAVAVCRDAPTGATSITGDFVDQAETDGLFVVQIDPLGPG